LSISTQASVCCQKFFFFLLNDGHMHRFFHFLVTGKMTALSGPKRSEGVRTWLYGGCLNTSELSWQRLRQWCGWQWADGHCAEFWHLSTIVLSNRFELWVSASPESFHYNEYCLLLCHSLGSVQELAHVDLWKESASLFMPVVEF
jgi:hypothetical protein